MQSHENNDPSPPQHLGSRIPSLDGWRAVSILMVLGLHARRQPGFPANMPEIYDFLFDGDLGVRFFFIISGFLITWLMLQEQSRSGAVNLRNFYIRRAFRILPVYAAFLAVLFLLQYFTSYRQSLRDWLANLTFTTNFASVPWPSQHLWSLSVEEQFYLVWPLLFVFLGMAGRRKSALGMILVPLLIAPIFRFFRYIRDYPPALSFICTDGSFFRYFDSLAIGCGCAILLAGNFQSVRAALARFPIALPVFALSLIALPDIFEMLHLPGRLIKMAGPTLQAVGFAVLLLQSVCYSRMKVYRWLNWTAIRHLGVLSYSIYIWQQIFFTNASEFGWQNAWWLTFPICILAAVAVAHISYYGLERPFLALRARFREKPHQPTPAPSPPLPTPTGSLP
jgi:peptidoglycan/LPS O-acetylase OafA/YrhL